MLLLILLRDTANNLLEAAGKCGTSHLDIVRWVCVKKEAHTEISPTLSCCGPDCAFINNEATSCLVCQGTDCLRTGAHTQAEKSHFTRLEAYLALLFGLGRQSYSTCEHVRIFRLEILCLIDPIQRLSSLCRHFPDCYDPVRIYIYVIEYDVS